MKRLATLILVVLVLISLTSCFPIREVDADATAIAEGVLIGLTQAAGTATSEAWNTPEPLINPTCLPGFGGCPRATIGSAIDSALGNPTPAPTLPPKLFTVVTKGSGDATENPLYNQAGVPERLGYGTTSINLVAKLAGGVELPVHETYSVNEYYMVQIDAWVEVLDLENRGRSSYDRVTCIWHDERHVGDPVTGKAEILCHAHIYRKNVIDHKHVIGIVERDVFVEVLKVDESARMAQIKISWLWIDADLVNEQ